jgi:glycosyltransferase involved in cell wall biosynthesis
MDLSVIITAYDEGALLRGAVESVAGQVAHGDEPLPETEIIVVVDRGATSETVAASEDIRRVFPRVDVVQNRQRRGASGNRNTGIERARGEWVAFLDGDDQWFPNAIETRWRALRTHGDVSFVAADFVRAPDLDHAPPGAAFTRDNERLRRLMGHPPERGPGPFSDGSPLRLRRPVAEFCQASLCWTGTVMVRRELVHRVGLFHERLVRGEDTHLWIRLAARSDLLFVPVPIALYRTRPSTLDRRGTTLWGWDIVATIDLLRRPQMRRWIRPLYRDRLVRMLNQQAVHLRGQRRFLAAAGYAAASALCWPAQGQPWRNLAASIVRRA